jgi:Conjugative transposon protein TcpC
MVRRAILDHDELPAAEDQILPDDLPVDDPPSLRSHPWRGAGGRWLIWVGRAVVWAVLLLIGYRGVLAIVGDETTRGSSPPAAPVASVVRGAATFPDSLAEAYALQFGSAYLNFSPATAAIRSQELAHFLPSAGQLGWNGVGTQHLLSEQVAGISVTGNHTAVVTLLASVDGGRLLELGVPVYASGGKLSVSGLPAQLPAPALAAAPASTASPDQSAEAALASQLPAFFQAYASGDPTTLARFAAPGAHITGLKGAVTFDGIDAVFAPVGGPTRSVAVTVTWKLPAGAGRSAKVATAPASLEMGYQLVVIRQGSSWDVRSIGALDHPQSPGPP